MNNSIKNTIHFTILFILLLLPILYAFFTAIDLEYSWAKRLVYLFVVIILLLIPAIFLKARFYFLLEGIFNFLFSPIEIASLYLNRQSTSVPFLQNILHTDIHEATELLVSVWPICIMVFVGWVIYFILAFNINNCYLIGTKGRKIIIICAVSICALGFLSMVGYQKYMYRSKPTKRIFSDAVGLVWMKLYKIYPYDLYLDLTDIIYEHYHQQALQQPISDFRFGIKKFTGDSSALYVLVIGEAARYDHFSIHGYPRNTSPLLATCSNIISYDSAFAQANMTRNSVPLIITRATADNADLAYREKTILEALQEAGFQTGFISKQIPSDIFKRVMQVSDFSSCEIKNIDAVDNYDVNMIQEMRSHEKDTLQFIVLHSIGSHFHYEHRYPKEFAHFQPTLNSSSTFVSVSPDNKKRLINTYDNSILYTDYFLHELIQYIDSQNRIAVILYMSDHGESLLDDERNLMMHGSYIVTKYEYHVPLLVWYSNEYAAKYPDKIAAMRNNTNKTFSSDVIFYSLLDIAGVEDIVDSTRSLCSYHFQKMDSIWVQTSAGDLEHISLHSWEK